jgi:hypothetical protein
MRILLVFTGLRRTQPQDFIKNEQFQEITFK